MVKRIIRILIVLTVTVFCLPACIVINPNAELAEYKADAKAELEAYAASKSGEEFFAPYWTVLTGLVADGKTAVDTARNKAAVDTAVAAAKQKINAIGLTEYKSSGKGELEDYAIAVSVAKELCTAANKAAVFGFVEEGMAAIDAAADRAGADTAVAAAKQKIDAFLPEKERKEWPETVIEMFIYDYHFDDLYSWGEETEKKLELSITFPREVVQGEAFEITVITTNITDENFEYYSCCQNLGVYVREIMSQSEKYMFSVHSVCNENSVLSVIYANENIEHIWKIETKHDRTLPTWGDYAPKGVYDIYLSNGEIYRNAIKIV